MSRWEWLFSRRKRMMEDLDQDIRDFIERGLPPEEVRYAALPKLEGLLPVLGAWGTSKRTCTNTLLWHEDFVARASPPVTVTAGTAVPRLVAARPRCGDLLLLKLPASRLEKAIQPTLQVV